MAEDERRALLSDFLPQSRHREVIDTYARSACCYAHTFGSSHCLRCGAKLGAMRTDGLIDSEAAPAPRPPVRARELTDAELAARAAQARRSHGGRRGCRA